MGVGLRPKEEGVAWGRATCYRRKAWHGGRATCFIHSLADHLGGTDGTSMLKCQWDTCTVVVNPSAMVSGGEGKEVCIF